MTSSGIYKLDNGKPYLNNCFPAKNLLRTPEEGRGHWLVARKCNLKKKPKSVLQAPSDSQEIQKKVSFEVRGKKGSQQENQEDIPGHVLDQAFLLKHHCVRKPSDLCSVNVSGLKFSKAKEKDFKHFHSVIYINASENLLPLEAFHTFPTLKELELAFNGIKTVYVKYGDFKFLEFLDLSFNSLTAEAICDLGILPHLRVLLLTGNGLTSLPPNLAVTEQEASVTSLTRRRYILRFPALETLMLDDNKLSSPNCFASLAGLRRLKKLSLDQNRIFRIPYLQQFQLRDGSGDWVGGKGNPHKEPQSMRQPKSCIFEASDEQPDYTVLPMKKDVDRTEVVFSSYPGFSTSEATKVRAFPPIFEILPVKSLKIRNQTLAPPFPELRYLSLAYNKIAKEDAILPVALFPSLCELIFHNNPLVAHTRGIPPLLKSFLQERLGIHLIRRKIVKAKHHILMPRKDSRKVKTQVPKVPKQPLILHHPPVTIVKSSSKEMLESDAGPTKEPLAARSSPLEQMPVEGLEGLSLSHRTFVPLPPICSDSTVHSEETTSQENDRPSHLSPDQPSDEDTKSMESIFLTQVNELPPSILPRDDSAMKKEGQRPPHTAPREVKRAWRKLPTASLSSKYHGYEELLTAKPDPAFIEPKGIQKNTQALQHMLKYPLLCRSSKPRLDKLQKHYVPKEKRAQRIPVPPPRKTRAQLLDDILIRMRDPRNITEAPLGAVLRQRTEQRLMNQKQYLEAKRLLKEFRARYRQLVHCSLRTMFRAAAPPPGRPALREGQPRFSRFLQFMDEFCQEPTASDSKG
ncbi:X-ray radiation resistance-associated protein 1 isoform X1 [Canis lupus baileyi]|uniref:X-ray radiation resistance-associated protein 1 n=2 Tax=Canis lupus familiaris TaxID=9615 RepID=A0A8C0NK45_CANLF|nr:X-ray radiation resistance-associated protein 1 isoform X1 [Canis lupus familiaris]XP_038286012.1 X-ray radiation resistance-associated protein 1 isoform X1 [Canis lupus familiaris]XP_038424550.1 X-ray radiation resistance-associated protein 1 isoform X1 [Canis lupus familiaris]|eukprot:XP_005633561.1 X-ray radiation resistance-associated protein 1 isoform X1 [Canis lupus familiaris]